MALFLTTPHFRTPVSKACQTDRAPGRPSPPELGQQTAGWCDWCSSHFGRKLGNEITSALSCHLRLSFNGTGDSRPICSFKVSEPKPGSFQAAAGAVGDYEGGRMESGTWRILRPSAHSLSVPPFLAVLLSVGARKEAGLLLAAGMCFLII